MSVDPADSQQPAMQANIATAQNNVVKFQENLEHYVNEQNKEMKNNLEGVMQQSLDLINSSLKDVKTSGIEDQGKVVASDFKAYQQSGADQDLSKLQNDLATLTQYLAESAKG